MKSLKRVYIEISNICNLQCHFCPEVMRPQKVMDPDRFEKALAQVAPLADEVCLHLMGEPTAHPQFARVLEVCSAHKAPVNLTTNGTLLQKRENKNLILSPIVRQVNFSLQSFFGNEQKQTLADYLSPIFQWTHDALQTRPELYINYRLWNQGSPADEDQKKEILAHVESEFQLKINPHVDVAFRKSKKLRGRLYLHFDSRFTWPHESNAAPQRAGRCHGLSSHIGIHADGTVVPCCLDKEAQLNLGNVNTQSLQEILAGPRATQIRDGFRRGVLVEELCQKCTYIRRFKSLELG